MEKNVISGVFLKLGIVTPVVNVAKYILDILFIIWIQTAVAKTKVILLQTKQGSCSTMYHVKLAKKGLI